MSVAAPKLVNAGSALARERLATYARYAELVAEQEQALEAEDLERFQALAEAVKALQEGMNDAGGAVHGVEDDPELGTDLFVARVSAILRATLARNERIQTRLGMLRRQAGAEIRRVGEGMRRTRQYVEDGTGGSPAAQVHSLDVRL